MTAQDPPGGAPLDRDSAFSYRCARCSRCCPRYHIQVNPYEILRLARLLGVSTTGFVRTLDGMAWSSIGDCLYG